jgi:leucyl-tRNA synthetase
MPYVPSEIEPRWQARWQAERAFATETDTSKPKYYVLDMFPYPSGAGLHVGHCEGYTATDILARYKRAKGFAVLHPMGWDAFGLPAENYAIKNKTHPAPVTQASIATFKRQINRLGLSYDWEHEVDTTDPNYYRWTQWIFLQMFKSGLAYQSELPINWCPSCKTGLANEEVKQGTCDRCGSVVTKRQLRQWVLKITQYAERLLADLEGLDWPVSTLTMQRDWIGRSDGAEITFVANGQPIVVFTTRPDTLYGATYMVLAPEHPLVPTLTTEAQRAQVEQYVSAAKAKSDRERMEVGAKRKTGVFTGSHAINPVNGQQVPVWIADYVLWGYGTGAIMAVPAHDQRDFEFAREFSLPVLQVIAPKQGGAVPTDRAYEVSGDDAVLVNSGAHSGLSSADGKRAIVAQLQANGQAKPTVNYKLRDWVFSRQRYWGEPIPVVHCEHCGIVAVPDEQLPVRLPDVATYEPSGTGESPLATIESWVNTPCPQCQRPAKRETNTMPQWAGSCWYYLRFIDAKNSSRAFEPALERQWMNVDQYIGGAEHAVLHLLYARFWHKFLFDQGLVSTKEPFARLRHQGMVLGEVELTGYQDQNDRWVSAKEAGEELPPDESRVGIYVKRKRGDGILKAIKLTETQVVKKGEGFVLPHDSTIAVDSRAHKMSKSRGNVINPDDVIREHGADALRLYEMFMGDFEQAKPWDTRAIKGVTRFLQNVWNIVHPQELTDAGGGAASKTASGDPHQKLRHKTTMLVGERIEGFKFNTAISAMMEYVGAIQREGCMAADREALVRLIAPFAPHMAEQCWSDLGHETLLCREPWPSYDPALVVEDVLTLPISVGGKLRGTVEVAKNATQEVVHEAAMQLESVRSSLQGKTIVKVVWVAGRMMNFVIQ